MTALRALIALVAALLLPTTALAQASDPILVPDVSSRTIEIKYSFTGEDLLLFGAILYPGGRRPDARVDIVVVIKGPTNNIRVREKRRVVGVWLNAESVRFGSVPGYYAVASSRPIATIMDERTAAIYELGLANLSLSPSAFGEAGQLRRFQAGLVDLFRRQELFSEDATTVEITDGVLYRARINIPARVPVGRYTAETYLVQDGRVIAVASRDIDIRKTGFDRAVAMAAENYGLFYGLLAVALSVGMGWLGGWLFRNR